MYSKFFLGSHTDTIMTDNIECTVSFEVKDDTHVALTPEMIKLLQTTWIATFVEGPGSRSVVTHTRVPGTLVWVTLVPGFQSKDGKEPLTVMSYLSQTLTHLLKTWCRRITKDQLVYKD